GPLSVLEGIEAGVDTVHTATSALAHGASEPPTEWTVRHARRLGFDVPVNIDRLPDVAEHFRHVAAREGKPLGEIAEYDPFYYEHQIPGGMISNMMSQLREVRLEHRLDEILEETARVRKELGYLVMVSPFSQYVMTQAVLNVLHPDPYTIIPPAIRSNRLHGPRLTRLPAELRPSVLGHYARPAAPTAPPAPARTPGSHAPVTVRPGEPPPPALPRARRERGPFDSDDDLLTSIFYNPE